MKNNFTKFWMSSLLLILIIVLFIPTGMVNAESVDPYSIISEVNALRASFGLPALDIDNTLMGTAQSTAQIMASNSNCSHIGGVKDRIASAGYGAGANIFATENIACGASLTLDKIMYDYWADPDHMIPMENGNYTHVGAAVAEINGYYYYVLHAAYISGGSSYTPPQNVSTNQPVPVQTNDAPIPVATSTANESGSITHVVKNGQAAWSIALAYETTIEEIVRLNNLYPIDNPLIYVGQELLIREAFTPTVSPTITNTLRAPSRTPWPTVTPRQIIATDTNTATPTPTSPPMLPDIPSLSSINRQTVGLIVLGVCLVGLFFVLYSSLKSNKS